MIKWKSDRYKVVIQELIQSFTKAYFSSLVLFIFIQCMPIVYQHLIFVHNNLQTSFFWVGIFTQCQHQRHLRDRNGKNKNHFLKQSKWLTPCLALSNQNQRIILNFNASMGSFFYNKFAYVCNFVFQSYWNSFEPPFKMGQPKFQNLENMRNMKKARQVINGPPRYYF